MPLKRKFEQVMKWRGISQAQFAREIGTDPRNVSAVMTRDSRKSDLADLTAKRYSLPLEWFSEPDSAPFPVRGEGSVLVRERPTLPPAGEQRPPANAAPERIALMNLQQQKEAAAQLIEAASQSKRPQLLYELARRLVQEGDLDEIPDTIMATWSAREKIKQLKKGTQ